ncbi:MAG: selenium-dependent molybdenum cofactor biosynthesis protein YqeB [Desulfobacterales bacterium]
MTNLSELTIVIKGAGEMASAVAWRLYMANFRKILMLETANPMAVRREVSFCEALHDGSQTVEGVKAVMAGAIEDIHREWEQGRIAVAVDPQWLLLEQVRPEVVVDAILAKNNLGTRMMDAELVIGLGPGFYAGRDVHMVIETNRGHDLGRIITTGAAETNTGVPGAIAGFTEERVLRAPAAGHFKTTKSIGDLVSAGEIIGTVAGQKLTSRIDGVLRGLIRSETTVIPGLKIGDVDPRGKKQYCFTISEKARAIGGSVLEAVLRVHN